MVRGDGARVFRITLSSRAVLAGALVLGVAVSVLGAGLGDYLQLRQITGEARTHPARLAEARAVIDTFQQRIATLQREAAEWRDLHARIWESIGPETHSTARNPGIGGGVVSERRERPAGPSAELDRLTESVMEEGSNLRALDRVMARAGKLLASLPSRWPVRGDINSEFGSRFSPWSAGREFHGGIDIAARSGTSVHAPAGGTVAFAGSHPEYGLTVVIDHGQDIRTVYGHLSHIAGKQGQKVERGALVGLTGNTGRSSGPHLHYEIQVRGRSVNPRAYLWD